MKAQRTTDTLPEMRLRSELHRIGLRFRVHQPVPGTRRKADVMFPRAKVVALCDGCFWHACPRHGTWPKANAAWWRAKIEANRARDRSTNEVLAAAGWIVVRVWEHEDPASAARRIAAIVRTRLARYAAASTRGARSSALARKASKSRCDGRSSLATSLV